MTITFRNIRESDRDLLLALYATTREAELAQTGWDRAQKRAFVQMQFEAQHTHYMKHYSGDSFQLILEDGAPIGRLYLGRWPEEIRIIDLIIAPERRNRGLGRQLMESLLEEARRAGKVVRIHVASFNPAMRLYKRLGFREVAHREVYVLMEWSDDAT
ncbi:MAG: GNAT family N-acetyltransferase [Myxococcota bacterium]